MLRQFFGLASSAPPGRNGTHRALTARGAESPFAGCISEGISARHVRRLGAQTYFSEPGSESFRGENFVSVSIITCAAGGAGTTPFKTISDGSSFFW